MAGHNVETYHKGEMDVHEQESTYRLFLGMSKWGSLVLSALLLHLTVTFCVKGANMFIGAGSAIALLVVGYFLLRSKPDTNSSH